MAKALLVGIFLLIGLFPTQAPARPIVYGTPDPSLGTQGWDVWQINPDGTGNLLLFHFDPSSADIVLSLRHPVWSRDGSLLAAAGTIPANSNLPNFPQGGLGVVVFDPVTGSKTPVTPLGTAFDEQVYLAFSGDKQRLAYTDGNLLETEFYVTTLDGRRVLVGGETTNESGGPLYNFGIDWAPTANQLVIPLTFPCGSVIRCVVTPPASPGPYPATGLFLVPPELGGLSNAIQLTVPQLFQVSCFFGLLPCLVTTQDVFPVFSPNGRLVAFTRWYTDVGGTFYGSQIALVDITSADRTPQAIYTTQQRVCGLSWSGDGTQLAFALGQDIGSLVAVCGNRGLWIVDAAPNSTPQQIPVPAPPLGTTESPSWNWGFNPVPSLSPSPFSPSGALAGGTAVTLTINGNNFLPSSTVSWNGQPRTPTFVSPTQLQLAVSATDIASAGTIPVTVVNPPPGGGTAAANFTIFPSFVLSVVRGGNGSSAVTSAPGGIACGATCSARFASGSQVVLTAAADAGSAFTGWSGCDSVSTNRCSITLTSTKTVSATFQLLTFRLTVNKAGTGNGTVTGTVVSGTGSGNVTGTVSPPGTISCGGVCSEVLNSGTQVRLTAAADPGSTFTGWSGSSCTGTNSCTVTVTADTTVTATFAAPPGSFALVVTLRGSAGGTVASSPSEISCSSSCAQLFDSNSQVRLSAAPAPGAQFKGWRGACSNTSGDCVVTMNAAQQVSAGFSAAYSQPALTPMSTTITAADFMELWTAINKLRTQNFGLTQFPFTDDPLQPSVSRIQARHLTDLRSALNDAYVQAGVSPPSYTEAITAAVTTIKAGHLTEVRSGVGALE